MTHRFFLPRGIAHSRRHMLGLAGATIALTTLSAPTVSFAEEQPTERFIRSGDVRLRLIEMGEGPLVVLAHGWPELSYSWRHQMPALAKAGYRVVAPDMRGYGGSDAPKAVDAYTIQKLTQDIVNVIESSGESKATLVGHDWGALVAWHCVLMHPDFFNGLAALSVPYTARGSESIIDRLQAAHGDTFHYFLYFQQDGVAEAEFDADPRSLLERLYASPETPRAAPTLTDPLMSAGGFIPRLGKPLERPAWMTEADLEHYVEQFEKSGFRGGINYYRNMHRNWETTPELTGATTDVPVMFLAGEKDLVIAGATEEQLRAGMEITTKDLRSVTIVPGAGHWIQQERPELVNDALLSFLSEIKP